MTVRWGIIGAGDIARKQTAPAIRDANGAELLAVHRQSMDAAQAFADEFGAAKAYDDVDALLADPDVDAVYISTPVYLHASQTIAAARAGKHVLVEKPMAMSSAECRQMIDACATHGVELMVCYYQRFNARHQKVRELVSAGDIGRVITATASMTTQNPPRAGAWRHDPALGGGGVVMDMGVHCFDTLRFILGEVKSVTALVDTSPGTPRWMTPPHCCSSSRVARMAWLWWPSRRRMWIPTWHIFLTFGAQEGRYGPRRCSQRIQQDHCAC